MLKNMLVHLLALGLLAPLNTCAMADRAAPEEKDDFGCLLLLRAAQVLDQRTKRKRVETDPQISPRKRKKKEEKEEEYEIPSRSRVRRTSAKQENNGPHTCKQPNLDGNICGQKYNDFFRFLRHTTNHPGKTINCGYFCTLCPDYRATTITDVHNHIREKHPAHRGKVGRKLQKFVGVLKSSKTTTLAAELRKKEKKKWKCSHKGCDRVYQKQGNLKRHIQNAHHTK